MITIIQIQSNPNPKPLSFSDIAFHSFRKSIKFSGHPKGGLPPAPSAFQPAIVFMMYFNSGEFVPIYLTFIETRVEKQEQEQDYEEQYCAVVSKTSNKSVCHTRGPPFDQRVDINLVPLFNLFVSRILCYK
jgi:hypothetical protein